MKVIQPKECQSMKCPNCNSSSIIKYLKGFKCKKCGYINLKDYHNDRLSTNIKEFQ